MISKNHRVNTDFQILYFLIGSCHTIDGVYSLLCELKEEREDAVKSIESMELKTKASILKAERLLASDDEIDQLLGKAELSEIEARKETFEKNVKAAREELGFINTCIDRLQSYRRYSHLPEQEAHLAMQRDEWRLELINRAENSLMTSGTIASDEFNTMRMHPDFETDILPEINNIKNCIERGRVQDRLFPEKTQPLRNLLSAEGTLAGLLPAFEPSVNGNIDAIIEESSNSMSLLQKS